MSLLLVLTLFIVSNAINLDKGVQSYINSLVVEFEKKVQGRVDSEFVIAPPLCLTAIQKSKFLLPKVLIWSPLE